MLTFFCLICININIIETLNNFFASVFTVEDLNNIPPAPVFTANEVIYSTPITPEIVKLKLLALKANKSPGHDKWHPHFLREIADAICTPLSILFRKSLQEGAQESDYCSYI